MYSEVQMNCIMCKNFCSMEQVTVQQSCSDYFLRQGQRKIEVSIFVLRVWNADCCTRNLFK